MKNHNSRFFENRKAALRHDSNSGTPAADKWEQVQAEVKEFEEAALMAELQAAEEVRLRLLWLCSDSAANKL